MSTRLTRRFTVVAVLVVALVAAVISYAHMRELALEHGEAWRSVLIPLAVDGMLVAATFAIVSQRRHCRSAGWVPWLGLTLGILASLAANVAAARPELVAQLIAAWPPVALAVSIETLVVVLRSSESALVHNVDQCGGPANSGGAARVSDPVGCDDAGSIDVVDIRSADAQRQAELIEAGGLSGTGQLDTGATELTGSLNMDGQPDQQVRGGGPVGPAVSGVREDVSGVRGGNEHVSSDSQVAQLIAAGAGRRKLAAELGLSEHQARQLLAERRNGQVTR